MAGLTERMNFRLTRLERERIEKAANDLGFSDPSKLIREALMPITTGTKVLNTTIDRRVLVQVYVELGRSNGNLRDILTYARATNDNGGIDVEGAHKQMKDIDRATKKLLKLIA